MSRRSTTTPETGDRARFLECAATVAETTPAAVTLILAAGLKRIAADIVSPNLPFDERA